MLQGSLAGSSHLWELLAQVPARGTAVIDSCGHVIEAQAWTSSCNNPAPRTSDKTPGHCHHRSVFMECAGLLSSVACFLYIFFIFYSSANLGSYN
uniref:Uncharacterized protein n=1 Tax=Anguilla anguilla TaxID=7936 RepID=A0A0E9WBD1_ANGAN